MSHPPKLKRIYDNKLLNISAKDYTPQTPRFLCSTENPSNYFVEKINWKTINSVIEKVKGHPEYNKIPRNFEELISRGYKFKFETTAEQLTKFTSRNRKSTELKPMTTHLFKVLYDIPTRNTLARAFVKEGFGLSCFQRNVRNTLIQDNYYDYDLKNAQPSIICYIADKANVLLPILSRYINDRREIQNSIYEKIKEVAPEYDIHKVKKLIITTVNHGNYITTLKEQCPDFHDEITELTIEYLDKLDDELNNFADTISKFNKKRYDTFEKREIAGNKHQSIKHIKRKFLTNLSFSVETDLMDKIIKTVVEETDLTKIKYTSKTDGSTFTKIEPRCITYEFDGIKLLKENCIKFEEEHNITLCDFLNNLTKSIMGIDLLIWDKKDIDDVIPNLLAESEYVPLDSDEIDTSSYLTDLEIILCPATDGWTKKDAFLKNKEIWERNHFKIVETAQYAEISREGGKGEFSVSLKKEADAKASWKHLKYYESDSGRETFINTWINGTWGIKTYARADRYPYAVYHYKDHTEESIAKLSMSPVNQFNLYSPCRASLLPKCDDKPPQFDEFKEFIKNHLHYLSGYFRENREEDEQFLYFYWWFMRVIITPHCKTGIAIVITGGQGSGKTTFIKIIEAFLGRDKVWECEDVSNAFGFNSLLRDISLVNFNELTKKALTEAGGQEKLKQFITDDSITINAKNEKQYVIKNDKNYVFTGNSGNGIGQIDIDNRRFWCIRTPSTNKNYDGTNATATSEYWEKFYSIIQDTQFIKHWYKELLQEGVPLTKKWVITAEMRRQESAHISKEHNFLNYLHQEIACDNGWRFNANSIVVDELGGDKEIKFGAEHHVETTDTGITHCLNSLAIGCHREVNRGWYAIYTSEAKIHISFNKFLECMQENQAIKSSRRYLISALTLPLPAQLSNKIKIDISDDKNKSRRKWIMSFLLDP